MKRPKCPCTKDCETRKQLGYLCRKDCEAFKQYEEEQKLYYKELDIQYKRSEDIVQRYIEAAKRGGSGYVNARKRHRRTAEKKD